MVKISVAVIFAAALAAPALASYAASDVESRALAEQAEVFERQLSEMSEFYGREIEDLTEREFAEFMERQVEVDDSVFARDADIIDVESRFGRRLARKVKGWFKGKPQQAEGVAAEGDPVQARGEPEEPAPGAGAPDAGAAGAAPPAAQGGATSPTDTKPKPSDKGKATNLLGKFLRWWRSEDRKNRARAADSGKKQVQKDKKEPAPAAAPAPAPAPETGAPPSGNAEPPAERDFDLDELVERDYYNFDELVERELAAFDDEPVERSLEYLEDLFEREFEDDVFERDFEGDAFERDFEDDVFERVFEDDVFERDFEEDMYERDFEDQLYEREGVEDIFARNYEYDELD